MKHWHAIFNEGEEKGDGANPCKGIGQWAWTRMLLMEWTEEDPDKVKYVGAGVIWTYGMIANFLGFRNLIGQG